MLFRSKKKEIQFDSNFTLMEILRDNGFEIEASCGGCCACATCHVYVKDDWFSKLPKKEEGEDDMLDQAFEPKSNSRLSCQLTVSDELNGLTVHLPEKQI